MLTPSKLFKVPEKCNFCDLQELFFKTNDESISIPFSYFLLTVKNGFDKISIFTFCHLGQKNFKKSKQIKNLKKTLDSDFFVRIFLLKFKSGCQTEILLQACDI